MTTDDEASAAASARVAALLERITKVELGIVVVAPPDAERMAARDRARAAADRGGSRAAARGRGPRRARGDDALVCQGRVQRHVGGDRDGRLGRHGRPIASRLPQRSRRRLAAAVVEDLVDDETLETLRATSDELDRGHRAAGTRLAGGLRRAGRARSPWPVPGVSLAVVFVAVCVAIGAVLGLGIGLIVLGIGGRSWRA